MKPSGEVYTVELLSNEYKNLKLLFNYHYYSSIIYYSILKLELLAILTGDPELLSSLKMAPSVHLGEDYTA